jgi:hypothetical protein
MLASLQSAKSFTQGQKSAPLKQASQLECGKHLDDRRQYLKPARRRNITSLLLLEVPRTYWRYGEICMPACKLAINWQGASINSRSRPSRSS